MLVIILVKGSMKSHLSDLYHEQMLIENMIYILQVFNKIYSNECVLDIKYSKH